MLKFVERYMVRDGSYLTAIDAPKPNSISSGLNNITTKILDSKINLVAAKNNH